MTTHIQPISEVTQRATSALIMEIGVEERAKLFKDMSVKDMVRDLKAQRKAVE